MATTLDFFLPYDAGAGSAITEDQWRGMARHWSTSGPFRGELSNFAVTATSGRNVVVGAGRVWIEGQWGERSTAFTQSLATNTSGNPRIDRIILRNDFTANRIEMDVLQGTPAGSPAAPALTQNTSVWEISLAQVLLANGYSTVATGDITDERTFAQGRPPGGPVLIACAAARTTNLPVADATNTAIDFDDSEEYDTANIHSLVTNPGRFTIPGGCQGLWMFAPIVTFENAVANTVALMIYKNGSLHRTLHEITAQSASQAKAIPGYTEEQAVPGDYFSIYVYQNTGSAKNINSARCVVRYLGPLA